MKKISVILVTGLLLATLSVGCGFIPQLPEMTQEQEAMITEYAAGLLLKYDNSYDGGIMSEEQLIEAEAKEKADYEKAEKQRLLAEEYVAKSKKAAEEKEKDNSEKKDKSEEASKEESQTPSNTVASINSDSVADFIGVNNVIIAYSGYDTLKSYPEDGNSAFSVDASNGNKLVVAKFSVKNSSDGNTEVDLFNQSHTYSLKCSNGVSYERSITLLLDDLSIYKNTLKGNETEETVLVFEVPESAELSGAKIEISTENGQANFGL